MLSYTPTVAIVDYSLGNLFSVQNACERVGLRAVVTSNKEEILAAEGVILPGVGAFGDAMDNLRRLDLVGPLRDLVARDTPLIGICLGQQLLMTESHEFGRHRGLGVFEGEVIRFDQPVGPHGILKVPQVGWNRLQIQGDRRQETGDRRQELGVRSEELGVRRPDSSVSGSFSPIEHDPFDGLPDDVFMYFVHSFHVQPARADVVLSTTRYGHIEFCSSLRRGNVLAFQFHPERSGRQGLRIYQNLAALIANRALTQESGHAA